MRGLNLSSLGVVASHRSGALTPRNILGANLIAELDASRTADWTLSGSKIASAPSLAGDITFAQSTDGNRPTLGTVGDKPAIVFPSTINNCSLDPDSAFSFAWACMVVQYKDGADATFDTYNSLFSDGGDTNRLYCNAGSANLFSSWAAKVRVNGAAESAAMLPLPLSIVEATGVPASASWGIGKTNHTTASSRSWQGPICHAIFCADEPTAAKKNAIRTALAAQWGIASVTLDAVAPFPTLGVLRAADVWAKIGVNTHVEYTDGRYGTVSNVTDALTYLGITRVRNGSLKTGNQGQANYPALATAGISMTLVMPPTVAIDDSLTLVDGLLATNPGCVEAIEGPNEINNFPGGINAFTYNGKTGEAAGQDFMSDLMTAVAADENLSGIPVYDCTGSTATNECDYTNMHPYPALGKPPLSTLQAQIATHGQTGKTFVITETGYYTDPTKANGVDEAQQARQVVNAILDAIRLGFHKVFIYELLDAYSNPSYPYGLVNYDGTYKPAADAIRNLGLILADAGGTATTFTPTSLSYTLSGAPATAKDMVFQKSDGTHILIVWAEPLNWNSSTGAYVAPSASTVTVNFGSSFTSLDRYDPLQSDEAVDSASSASSYSWSLADAPAIMLVS